MKLIEKIERTAIIELVSGLHIGDSKDSAGIGGVDSPVVRLKKQQTPYIPGSSLKGKIRSLLEQTKGANRVGGNDEINKIFGITENKKNETSAELSRLIFRDATMTTKSKEELSNIDTDMPYTEIKWENSIDRVKGAAKRGGLRQIERIIAGARFNFSVIINVYENEDKKHILEVLQNGMELLEHDYLGGSGTRGYGQIKFESISDNSIWTIKQ